MKDKKKNEFENKKKAQRGREIDMDKMESVTGGTPSNDSRNNMMLEGAEEDNLWGL